MPYDNTNSGVLFRNDRKDSDAHPDYTGKIDINGQQFWLSAWLNEQLKGENAGRKYFSIKARPVEDNSNRSAGQMAQPQTQTAPPQTQTYDDDIPF